MPTIRYHLRNEYSLGNSDLYRTADKDDPEAVLEGVAMAGLVGFLRQLGDLAELAADIFRNLHEEIMNTSSRGLGVMLRIRQLETELPLMEKSILAQPMYSHFSYSEGVEWHGDHQIGQNLVTVVEMPSFVMNSYKECRGPPKLFMLDKFDVSGDGACLRRYTDPSFYRTTSLATLVEEEARLERQGCKLKKKSQLDETETPHPATSEDNSEFEPISDHDPVEAQSKNGRLKLRKLNENGSCIRNYMGGNLLEIHSLESESSQSKHTISTESSIDVCDIATDASSNTLSSRKPSLAKDEITVPPTYELDKQMIEKNDPKMFPVVTGESFDGYLSDEFASEMDNYTDALTTMDSETEMDQSRKLGLGSRRGEPQQMDAELNVGQLDHEAQLRVLQCSLENSGESPGFNTLFRKGVADPSFSDTLGNLAAQLLSGKRTSSTPTLTSDIHQCENGADGKASDISAWKSTSDEVHSTSNLSRFHSQASCYRKPRLVTAKDQEGTVSYDSDADQGTIENSNDARPSDSANVLTCVSQPEETYPPTDSDFDEIEEQESKQQNRTPENRVKPSPAVESSDGKSSADHLDDNLAEFSESEDSFDSQNASQYPCISLKEETVSSTKYHAVSAELCEQISDLVVDKGVDITSYEQRDSLPDSSLNRSGRMSYAENKLSNISKTTQEINIHAIAAGDKLEESDMKPSASVVEADKVVSESQTVVRPFTMSDSTQSCQVVHSSPVATLDGEAPESQIPVSTESAAEGELNPSPSRPNAGLPPLPPSMRKPHAARNGPRDALIEAVASHDKSQLRKAPELFRSSAMPKPEERGAYLEQIRNKSFSLKPTVLAAPSLKFKGGPPTNLKVIAILEKANAIRQACAGSDDDADDDDDDDDSWSDS